MDFQIRRNTTLIRGTASGGTGTKITSGSEPQVYTTDSGTEQYSIVTMQFLDTPTSQLIL